MHYTELKPNSYTKKENLQKAPLFETQQKNRIKGSKNKLNNIDNNNASSSTLEIEGNSRRI